VQLQLTLILTAYGPKDPFLQKEVSPGWLRKIFLKIKNTSQTFFQRFSIKLNFQRSFDDNVSVIPVFIKGTVSRKSWRDECMGH
jgi:hypothetical protein